MYSIIGYDFFFSPDIATLKEFCHFKSLLLDVQEYMLRHSTHFCFKLMNRNNICKWQDRKLYPLHPSSPPTHSFPNFLTVLLMIKYSVSCSEP